MNVSIEGFSPRNLERIYLGEPALVDGDSQQLPSDVLTSRQYEVAVLMADGLSHRDICDELGISKATISSYVNGAYERLNISSRSSLAGFFPLSANDSGLENKQLEQLAQKELEVIDGLSRGKTPTIVAVDLYMAESTVGKHVKSARKTWGCNSLTKLVRVANGVRARHAREVVENGEEISKILGDFALHRLVGQEAFS